MATIKTNSKMTETLTRKTDSPELTREKTLTREVLKEERKPVLTNVIHHGLVSQHSIFMCRDLVRGVS